MNLPLRAVDVCDALTDPIVSTPRASVKQAQRTHLSEVELGILLVGDALDLEEGGVGAGVALAALVAENAALAVESTTKRRKSRYQRRYNGGRGGRRIRGEAGARVWGCIDQALVSSVRESTHPSR